MTQGKVKWFNERKGYGFITDPQGRDVFFHYSAIVCDGFKIVQEGVTVMCEIEETPKGPIAKRVRELIPTKTGIELAMMNNGGDGDAS